MNMTRGKYIRTKEIRQKMSIAKKGKCAPWTIETNKKRIYTNELKEKLKKRKQRGKLSFEEREKASLRMQKRWTDEEQRKFFIRKGKDNPAWKGGIYPENQRIRGSQEYKLWRKSIFERDNYMCTWCSEKENLQADHVKPFSLYPELRFAIDNGRTLCIECHKKTHTYLNRWTQYEGKK